MVETRKATERDARALSGTTARAFEDDPVMSWLYPGLRRLESFFLNYELKLHLAHDAVYTTDDVAGGAIWAPPGKWRTSVPDVLRVAPALMRATGTRIVRGIGSALIAPILERCDREGVPAHLESSKEAKIPFYRRHGFEVTTEIQLPKGPEIWPMWRDPQPA